MLEALAHRITNGNCSLCPDRAVRLRHENVEDIEAQRLCLVHRGFDDWKILSLQVLAAQPDLAHADATPAQRSVSHDPPPSYSSRKPRGFATLHLAVQIYARKPLPR